MQHNLDVPSWVPGMPSDCALTAMPLRCLRTAGSTVAALMEAAHACLKREKSVKEMMQPSRSLLVMLLVVAQTGPGRDLGLHLQVGQYSCKSDRLPVT